MMEYLIFGIFGILFVGVWTITSKLEDIESKMDRLKD